MMGKIMPTRRFCGFFPIIRTHHLELLPALLPSGSPHCTTRRQEAKVEGLRAARSPKKIAYFTESSRGVFFGSPTHL